MEDRSLEKLKGAFVAVLHVDPSAEFSALRYAQAPGWDSVAHMALVAEIEGAFDIMLTTEEVIDLSSFPKAQEIAGKHGVRFDA